MKRLLPLLCLLALPHLASAQPAPANPPAPDAPANAPNQPDFAMMARVATAMQFAFDEDNSGAVARMGAVYNTFQNATSYKGVCTFKQTTIKEGKITSTNSMALESVWVKDPKTGVFKSRVVAKSALMENGKMTVNKFIVVNDGLKTYRYYSDRNVWMEEPQTEKSSYNHARLGVFLPWATTLLRVSIGSKLKTENRADGTVGVSSEDGGYQAVFNADGTLQSWKAGAPGKTFTELRFVNQEFNPPVADTEFVWQTPDGAQKIVPEEPKNTFNFNFDF